MVSSHRQIRCAFTLFEMLIVTLIIGIMGVMALPIIGGITGGPRVETAADQLLADIEYCQSLNVARTDRQIAIRFDQTQNRYQLEYTPTGSTTATVMRFPGDNQLYVNDFSTGRNSYLAGVSLGTLPGNTDTYWLTFNRYGQPQTQSGPATKNIQIPLNGSDRTVYVNIAWDTGEVTITK